MTITLNGTTGITTPDVNVTAQSSNIVTTGNITAVDATLSGGVYVGGTGAANYFDDYEEGTWTPSLTLGGTASGNYNIQNGYYKIDAELFENPAELYNAYVIENSDFKEINPEWTTLYFSGGKKEKINKIDLVGFLSKKGQLKKDEIGLITVMDHASYVAVKKQLIKNVLRKIKTEKIKGKRLKIAISM